ncbi:MAG: PAS domain S-box protein [Phycisphaerae bacterium]|nr:PAS domain S-box protein [Phycisphaerae bacterium]MDD5381303.1 PAS domain S-box protein [Phycisphaerae bacterium]
MGIPKDKSDDSKNLREQAEKKAKQQIVEFRNQRGQDTAELIHELRVHQIELEIQNEELRNAQLELAESRNKYCELYDFAPVGYFTLNKEGLVVGANLTGAALLGEERGNLLKSKFSHFIAPSSQDDFYLYRKRVVESEARQSCEVKLRRKDGTEFIAQLVSVAVTEQKGKYDQFRMTMIDITERKKAEEELRKSEYEKTLVLDNASEIIAYHDTDLNILWANRAYLKATGLSLTQIQGKKCYHAWGLDSPCKDCPVTKTIETGEPQGAELTPQNQPHWPPDMGSWLSKAAPVKDKTDSITGAIEVAYDITERKKAEQELLEDQAKLKSLASQLVLAKERERRRLATELHDRISQSLVISKIKLDTLRKSWRSRKFDKVLEDICNSIGQTIQDTRALTFDLGSPVLHELGFETAVSEWLTDRIQKKHDITVEFEDDREPKPLDDDVRILLFRDVRELLTNVVKHASAHKVKVSIRKVGSEIHISIEDDGWGFDTKKAAATAAGEGGFGLFSIRERLGQLGGHLEIESEPGCGTKATLIAPLKQAKSE